MKRLYPSTTNNQTNSFIWECKLVQPTYVEVCFHFFFSSKLLVQHRAWSHDPDIKSCVLYQLSQPDTYCIINLESFLAIPTKTQNIYILWPRIFILPNMSSRNSYMYLPKDIYQNVYYSTIYISLILEIT